MKKTNPYPTHMKTKVARLLYIGVAILGVMGTHSTWAYFDGLARIPYPASGRWEGDAQIWNNGANGWTWANLSTGGGVQMTYVSQGQRIDDSSWDTWDAGSGTFQFKTTAYYWDGTVYKYGLSRIVGNPSWYASGDVWHSN